MGTKYIIIANSDPNTSLPKFLMSTFAPSQMLEYVEKVKKAVERFRT